MECPIGADHIVLGAKLNRFVDVPKLHANIKCGRCRQDESKTEDSALGTWFCIPCSSDQYVIDSNNAAHSCQTCPAGGVCNGSAFLPSQGSEWTVDGAAGVYQIVGCAPGSYIIKEPYLMQACLPCEAGSYCTGGADPRLKCAADTFSTPLSSSKDACVGAEFVDLTISLPISEEEFTANKQAAFSS